VQRTKADYLWRKIALLSSSEIYRIVQLVESQLMPQMPRSPCGADSGSAVIDHLARRTRIMIAMNCSLPSRKYLHPGVHHADRRGDRNARPPDPRGHTVLAIDASKSPAEGASPTD
jgi:hypothetical protein